jgi:hypothetical protein
MLAPIEPADLEAAERLLSATLAHCRKLRSQQRHASAANSAAGAIRLMRTLSETQANHGFFADFVTRPFAGLFEEFV